MVPYTHHGMEELEIPSLIVSCDLGMAVVLIKWSLVMRCFWSNSSAWFHVILAILSFIQGQVTNWLPNYFVNMLDAGQLEFYYLFAVAACE
jgi:hypothetical protein